MKLYDSEVSSAASRVRIALALKGFDVERQPAVGARTTKSGALRTDRWQSDRP